MADSEQESDKIPVQCISCNYQWDYTGKFDIGEEDAKVTCYKCQTQARLRAAAKLRQKTEEREADSERQAETESAENADNEFLEGSPESTDTEEHGEAEEPIEEAMPDECEYTATALALVGMHSLDRSFYRDQHDERPEGEVEHQWWSEDEIVTDGNFAEGATADDAKIQAGFEQIRRLNITRYRRNDEQWEYQLFDGWQERRAEAFDNPQPKADRIRELEKDLREAKVQRDEYQSQRDDFKHRWEKARDTNTDEIMKGVRLEPEYRAKLISYAVQDEEMELAIRLVDDDDE